jgi:uncharacterized protein (TIGR02231 family)
MHGFRFPCSMSGLVLAVATLGLGLAASSVAADEISVTTRVGAVTVFPTGAEVTRDFVVKLPPGEHTLQVVLPHDIQTNSIQIEGDLDSGVAISALDLKKAAVDTSPVVARRSELTAQIETLETEVAREQKVQENATFALDLVKTLADRKLRPTGQDLPPPIPDPGALIALLDMVDGRLAQISATILESQVRVKAAQTQIFRLKRLQEESPVNPPQEWLAKVHVLAPKATAASFRLSYRLNSASWEPLYEARLKTDEAGDSSRLELVRNAVVIQTTTEDWTDIALTLSTAQRTSSISAPMLKPQGIGDFTREAEQEQPTASVSRTDTASHSSGAALTQAPSNKLGFNVLYTIPGRVTIDKTGESKTVRIGTSDGAAELHLSAVPKLDLTAYLGASVNANIDTPLLPGRTMLFRDGVFVGEGRLLLTGPRETMFFGFGADDLVTIERREVDRKSGETGLVSTAYIEERSYRTTMISSHSFGIPITIKDQVPVSDDGRIRVDLLQQTTRPDGGRDYETPGVYSWTQLLEPGVPQSIDFGFRVTWPKGITR